ncbi:LADA_0G15500g1_1 [Lachancea dasiensis]|uniref:LADA_0G15500g1_1 n=1 Tax=Lachancea dasiensis TaxID=1072105 RepID=A0A1G4JWL4_9SACH|nr:LADA_0G15500g1_1 [Lachancea dasiensis]
MTKQSRCAVGWFMWLAGSTRVPSLFPILSVHLASITVYDADTAMTLWHKVIRAGQLLRGIHASVVCSRQRQPRTSKRKQQQSHTATTAGRPHSQISAPRASDAKSTPSGHVTRLSFLAHFTGFPRRTSSDTGRLPLPSRSAIHAATSPPLACPLCQSHGDCPPAKTEKNHVTMA